MGGEKGKGKDKEGNDTEQGNTDENEKTGKK